MALTEREELEMLELEEREKALPPPASSAVAEPKNPSTMESLKSGFMEQELPAGAGAWDKFVAFVGEEGPVIAGGTIGAIKGAAGGALLGPAGAIAGGAMGGMIGAGAVRAAQEGVQQVAGTDETITESAKDIGKSAIEGASGELLGPGLKLLGRASSKMLGWTAGLSKETMKAISDNPEIVLNQIGKVTKYDIDDEARSIAKAIKADLSKDTELVEALNRVTSDANPADALAHIMKPKGTGPLGELTQTGTQVFTEELTRGFVEKKIAYDATRLLNTAGIMDVTSSPSAMLAAIGLMNMSLGTGMASIALKSPALAGVGTAAATKATKVAGKALGKKGSATVGQAAAHSVPDEE